MTIISVREGGPTFKGLFDFDDSPLSRAARQPLLLGVFLNLQDIRYSSLPTSNSWTFDYNVEIVQKAEELGFGLAFTRAQWLPKGHHDGEASLEAFIALGAMAAVTNKIMLISTMHVLYGPLHPLHIAKYCATLDHIAKGRWGINMITGNGYKVQPLLSRGTETCTGEACVILNSPWSTLRTTMFRCVDSLLELQCSSPCRLTTVCPCTFCYN
jgi:FMNH2-dependent dimethyl sulfone monooxygenase